MLTIKSYVPGTLSWLNQAATISLFTDARAGNDDQVPDGSDHRRGHWGDAFLSVSQSLGSRLWLLKREKLTQDVINRARDYAYQALVWMLEGGWVLSLTVTTIRLGRDRLGIHIQSRLPDGSAWSIDHEYSVAQE